MTEEERAAAARLLALSRPRDTYICEQCRRSFPAVKRKPDAANRPRFCSDRCRSKAQYHAAKARQGGTSAD